MRASAVSYRTALWEAGLDLKSGSSETWSSTAGAGWVPEVHQRYLVSICVYMHTHVLTFDVKPVEGSSYSIISTPVLFWVVDPWVLGSLQYILVQWW